MSGNSLTDPEGITSQRRRNAKPDPNPLGVFCTRMSPVLIAAVTMILVGIIVNVPAAAQNVTGQPEQPVIGLSAPPGPAAQGIEVLVKPYLWLPWTSTGISPSNSRLSGASEVIDPGKLISHTTWVPFMGAAEFRYDGLGLLVDYLHAPLKEALVRAISSSLAAAEDSA